MPCNWQTLFGIIKGTARFVRHFHRPTNLADTSRVELVVEGVCGVGEVRMNGVPVAEFDLITPLPLCIDITALLQLRNTLQIDITFDPTLADQPGGLYGVVALDIREFPDSTTV